MFIAPRMRGIFLNAFVCFAGSGFCRSQPFVVWNEKNPHAHRP
jgi:hypothetical protein